MQQLYHHRPDRRKDLSAFLPLVRNDGATSLPGRMLSKALQRMGTCGSGTQGTDVVAARLTTVGDKESTSLQIRLSGRKISVHPLVQPDHTNFHPTEPTQGYFRSLGKNGSFVGMKKPLSPLFTGVSGLFRFLAELVGDAGFGPATLTV